MAMSQTTPRKFRRRAEARPDELLDAALDLFIEKGFAATRVEDIAKRAGLSKGAVYLYYESKEAILEALVRRGVVPIVASVAEMGRMASPDPRKSIEMAIVQAGQRMADPRIAPIPRIILAEAGRYPHFTETYREEVLNVAFAAITGMLNAGIEAGAFRPVNPELAIRSVIGPIVTHILLGHIFGVKSAASPLEFLATHLDILFNGLLTPEARDV